MRKNDLTGKQIGYWQVGEAFHKGKKIYYHCTCKCGKEKDVQSSKLNTGKSNSCGCNRWEGRVEDLTEKQIGYWKVGEAFRKGKKIYYHCTCKCGKKRDVSHETLSAGKSSSCGCKDKVGQVEDITGKDIGWLHVEEKIIINNCTYWKCTCKCGKHTIISQHQIHDCKAQSCNCKGYGVGEKIKESLQPYFVDGTYIPALNRTALNKNNTSGCTGVNYRADRGKWRAYIKFQRKTINLGTFDTYEDAVAVRKIAEKEYFGKYIEGEQE